MDLLEQRTPTHHASLGSGPQLTAAAFRTSRTKPSASRLALPTKRRPGLFRIPAVTSAIQTYLAESKKWEALAAKGAPRFPTMHAWDGKGRPHRGGVTSDAGKVTTYIDDQGARQPLALSLQDSPIAAFHPDWIKPEAPLPDACDIDEELGSISCPVDGWSTMFKPESRSSFNVARPTFRSVVH